MFFRSLFVFCAFYFCPCVVCCLIFSWYLQTLLTPYLLLVVCRRFHEATTKQIVSKCGELILIRLMVNRKKITSNSGLRNIIQLVNLSFYFIIFPNKTKDISPIISFLSLFFSDTLFKCICYFFPSITVTYL